MKKTYQIRADALTHREEFEQVIEDEIDPKRCAFFRFVYSQALISMSAAEGDVKLDMRGVAALAARMLDREITILEILSGKNLADDW